jgi:DNA modification methylase
MSGGEETRPDRPTNHPVRANHHPTVKPLALMRWLVRLVTPPGGTVLDPFAGSGSTGCAAVQEGVNFVGIEQAQEYVEIAKARIAYWENPPEPETKFERAKRSALARDARKRAARDDQLSFPE